MSFELSLHAINREKKKEKQKKERIAIWITEV